jgi:hypothetical protein
MNRHFNTKSVEITPAGVVCQFNRKPSKFLRGMTGYMGSLFHEATDAQAFADWGFDFVKHDTCSPGYCGVYNDTGRDGTGEDGANLSMVFVVAIAY